ncbi:MAG: bifunctional phosphopantothenoylcysteine decarboxylase/phosphopantothenate--cysteine ligase CoaBC [Candidatus Sumerlaeia bacterium]|nr:bifunctional phosphopantothenoylcysteine decarboxylase/phosphopantothenate--cysteine ligase CoaBC [Candidatus Sumerlaeia bacterium]
MTTPVETLRGAKVLLGVSSSIAAYRALDVASTLRKAGVTVRAVLTPETTNLVGKAAFDAITGERTVVDLWHDGHSGSMDHLALTKWADLFLIAPATGNTLAMLAAGMAPNALGTFALAWNKTPLLIAPAMNPEMWRNKATQENVARLCARGHRIVEPAEGLMACQDEGVGRLAPVDDIVAALACLYSETTDRPLAGKRVLITAGPTREFADDVRCLTNPSTGRMGLALAHEAARMGGRVSLVIGPTTLETSGPWDVLHRVESADEMLEATLKELPGADIVVFSAAVSDWRPAERHAGKDKKGGASNEMTLRLVRTPDIAATCNGKRQPGQIFVGFAAESSDLETHGREKMSKKGFDLLFANAINEEGSGFAGPTNAGLLLAPDGTRLEVPLASKETIARIILRAAVEQSGRSR